MKTIFSRIHLNKKQIVGLFALILISAVGQMLLPSFLAQMISHGVAQEQVSQVYLYGCIMAGVTVVSCVVSFLSVKMASYISTDFASQLREQIFAQVQSFSAAEMDKFGTASLVTRSTSDITNIQSFLTMLLRLGLMAPMMAAAGLVFSAATGGEVSSVLLVAIPVLLGTLSIIMVLASRYSIRLRKKLDGINRLFLESLEGVRVIRAFNKQKTESDRFEQANEDFAKTTMAAGRIGALMMPAIGVIFGVTTAAVLGMGAVYVESGAMEVASLVANAQYISMVLTSVMMLSLVGYVPQKNVLFSGDIGYNLNFGNKNGTEADWAEAAKIACAQEFIEKKEQGYHAPIAQGGTNLSGGQRQRTAIARAMMKHPEIYVFDDSFSALDMKTDRQLRQNLKEHIGDATVIMVAQRIGTIVDADRILVVDDGQIIGNGTHEELLKICPLYREIAQIQLGKEAL